MQQQVGMTNNTSTDYSVGNLIYDAQLYDGLNTFDNDLEFYKKWLPKEKNVQVLELCCGTGRLTIPLAKLYNMCGVDNAPAMLDKARTKAAKEGVTIDFVEADVRTLALPNQYDVVFIPFNSIHHLYHNQDLFDTLRVVKKHLKPDGLFLLDCYNPNIRYIVEAEKELQPIAEYEAEDGRKVLIKQHMHYESHTQINRIQWHYFINDHFHSVQHLDMRMYFPQELDTYLAWMGFSIQQKFGGYNDEAFLATAEKQVFVCTLSQ